MIDSQSEVKREVELGESITIQQLSQRMSEKASQVIKTLFDMGIETTINQAIDQDTAVLVVEALRRVHGAGPWSMIDAPCNRDYTVR